MSEKPTGKMETVSSVEFGSVQPTSTGDDNSNKNIEMIYEIPVRVHAELGNTSMTIRDLLTLGPKSVIELERLAGESIDLLVNEVLVGKADVVVVNENFGLRITEITSVEDRLKNLSS